MNVLVGNKMKCFFWVEFVLGVGNNWYVERKCWEEGI